MTDKNQEDIEKKEEQAADSEDVKESAASMPEQAEPDADKMEFTQEDIDTIGEIGNIFMGSASTTLSTLLKQKVQITTPQVEILDSIDEAHLSKEDGLIIEIDYTQGLNGKVLLVIKKEDAVIITDVMGGGTGVPAEPELDEIKVSAMGEAMNQMVGNASTALSTMLNMAITISPPDVRLSAKDKEIEKYPDLKDKGIVSVKFNLKIGNLVDSELYQLMPITAAKAQVTGVTEVMKDMTENLKYNSPQSIVDEMVEKEKVIAQEEGLNMDDSSIPSQARLGDQLGAQPGGQNQVTVQPVQFASFDKASALSGTANQNLNLVMDVNLGLTVELGRAELPIKNVLELTRGSIIELDKVAGEPVELYANGKLIAKGEVVVIEDNFGLRITSIISPEQRIKHL